MKKIQNKELEVFLNISEELGWNYTIWNEPESNYGGWHHNERNYVELSKYSPAGEDFSMIIDFDKEDAVNSFLENFREYKDSFSSDEHAEMWIKSRGTSGIPKSIQVLLDDAKAIKQMLFELWNKLYDTLQKVDKRKVLITNELSNDAMLIITDAPKKAVEQWCRNYVSEIEDGENTYFDSLEKNYYVKVLYDSERYAGEGLESSKDDIDVIGYDEVYELYAYYEILGVII